MMKTYLDHQVHSLNDSTSKQRYTIPKAPRELVKSSSISGDASYQLPSTLNSRFTTLGYGQKTNLVGKDNYPGPGQYEFKSIVEQDHDAKKGISFAVSRELMKQQSILGKINTYPSPDRYNLPQSIKDRKYTFGLRTQIKDHNTNPGPGQYEAVKAIDKKGEYQFSRFHNSGAAIIGKDKDRFKTQMTTNVPEPGRYSLESLGITKDGYCPKGGYKSTVSQTFGKAERQDVFKKTFETPAPWAYNRYSEFQ